MPSIGSVCGTYCPTILGSTGRPDSFKRMVGAIVNERVQVIDGAYATLLFEVEELGARIHVASHRVRRP